MHNSHVSGTSDYINQSDVEEAIEELEDELEDVLKAQEAYEEAKEELESSLDEDERADLEAAVAKAERALKELRDEWSPELEELDKLKSLLEDMASCGGDSLINDDHFEDYARELAEDIGAIGRDAQWPLGYIDWEKAADALKMDYTAIEFDGGTFWTRA